jgi:hypothetical protein
VSARHGLRVALALVIALSGTACGVRPTGVVGAGEPAEAQQAVPQTTVYLVHNGRLTPVRRVAFPGAPQAALYDLWRSGPTEAESAAGMWSPFSGILLFDIKVRGGTLSVHYYRKVAMSRLLMAQIVCSGAAQPDVRRVRLVGWWPGLDAERLTDVDHPPRGWSAVVGRERKCSNYSDLMPP